jgi:NAD-dependent deacetylase
MIRGSLLERLKRADSIAAFTGAGMSAESGVPTFRGNDGIWKKFRPEELANLDAFLRNPALVWEWYAARRNIISGVRPNAGHFALARMEHFLPLVTVITQNIDNLHRRAGSTRVFELHGNIERSYCMKCGRNENPEMPSTGSIPKCPGCGGLIRPDVVWFGEMLPEEQWNGAVRALASADVVLSIGTSGVVFPAAGLPLMARRNGAYVVEINTEKTDMTPDVDEFLQGKSGDVLPMLVASLEEIRKRSA